MNENFKKYPVPVFGEPVYIITANKIVDSGLLKDVKRNIACLSSIKYYAVEGITVSKLGYTEDMTGYVINENMIDSDTGQKLDITVKFEEIGEKIFITYDEAANLANEMNEEAKSRMQEIVDAVSEAFNNFDDIILAQQPE